MPKIGEISPCNTVFKKHRAIYVVCPECGKERWVEIGKTRGQGYSGLCRSCANSKMLALRKWDKSPAWKGGRTVNYNGYIEIRLRSDDFFYSMADRRGYVKEHRLVMAKHLGRCLHCWEIIHHKNHKRDDNRFDNLQLTSDIGHKQASFFEAKVKRLENKIKRLEAEIKELESNRH